MNTSEFQKKINTSTIIPLHGNDFIYIGLPLTEFNQILRKHYFFVGDQYVDGYCLLYNITLTRSLRISIDILNQCIYQIEFFGHYKGTYQGIGIGSTISSLLKTRDDVYFDEEYILVGDRPYDLIIKIDNEDRTIDSLEEVMDHTITHIQVRNDAIRKA